MSNPLTAYKQTEIDAMYATIELAKAQWKKSCASYFKKNGDKIGSCVLGAGIAIWGIPKGMRKARRLVIIDAWSVSPGQSSLIWEHGVDAVVAFLKKSGIDAYYVPGRMD